MLDNRFSRLLTTILMGIVIIVPMSILEILSTNYDWTWNIRDGFLFITPALTFVICFVGQLLGDIMDVETWLNNNFVTFLKRLIFFAALLGSLLIGTGMVLGTSSLEQMFEVNASALEIGVSVAGMFAPGYAFSLYVFGYIKYSKDYHDRDGKKWLPFFFPISYIASILTAVLAALIVKMANLYCNTLLIILGVIEFATVIIPLVACFKTEVWPFEEESPYSSSPSSSRSYGGYSGSSSSCDDYGCTNSSNSGQSTEPHECEHCAYYSYMNPVTELIGDYCYYKQKPLGALDNAYQDCQYFVKSR